jgi:hypothetical protein
MARRVLLSEIAAALCFSRRPENSTSWMERRSRVDNTRRRLLSDNRRVPTSIEASEGKEQVTLQRTSSKRRIVDKASGSAERTAPAMIYNWTGFYIGGHIGSDWRNNTVLGYNNSQFLAGVQGGADYQFAQSWVIGVEANYSFKPSTGNNGGFAFATTGGAGLVTNNSIAASARLRVA